MVKNYLATTLHMISLATSGCNPAFQERRSISFAARSRADAFCHSHLQTRIVKEHHAKSTKIHAASTAQNRPSKSGASPKVPFFLFHSFSFLTPSSNYSFVMYAFSRPHIAKVLRECWFLSILTCKPGSRFSPARFSLTTFPDRGSGPPETETLLRQPAGT